MIQNSQKPDIAVLYGLRAGIGLAAPQVNVSKRMIAVHLKEKDDQLYSYALFNPKLVSHSVEKSILDIRRRLSFRKSSRFRLCATLCPNNGCGYGPGRKSVQLRLKGIAAICFQHEIDHLNGIMFYLIISIRKTPMPFRKIQLRWKGNVISKTPVCWLTGVFFFISVQVPSNQKVCHHHRHPSLQSQTLASQADRHSP